MGYGAAAAPAVARALLMRLGRPLRARLVAAARAQVACFRRRGATAPAAPAHASGGVVRHYCCQRLLRAARFAVLPLRSTHQPAAATEGRLVLRLLRVTMLLRLLRVKLLLRLLKPVLRLLVVLLWLLRLRLRWPLLLLLLRVLRRWRRSLRGLRLRVRGLLLQLLAHPLLQLVQRDSGMRAGSGVQAPHSRCWQHRAQEAGCQAPGAGVAASLPRRVPRRQRAVHCHGCSQHILEARGQQQVPALVLQQARKGAVRQRRRHDA